MIELGLEGANGPPFKVTENNPFSVCECVVTWVELSFRRWWEFRTKVVVRVPPDVVERVRQDVSSR